MPNTSQAEAALSSAFQAALTIFSLPNPPTPLPVRPIVHDDMMEDDETKPKETGWQPDVAEPWAKLVEALKKIDLDQAGVATAILRRLIARLVASQDKTYLEGLSGVEAGAASALVGLWARLDTSVIEAKSSNPSAPVDDPLLSTLETAPSIILRLAQCAVSSTPHEELNLSRLGLPSSALKAVEMAALCEIFGLDVKEVKSLDVSLNKWEDIPPWLYTAFPNLRSLDLTSTGPVSYLPLSVLRLPLDSIVVHHTNIDNPPSDIICPELEVAPKAAKGPSSAKPNTTGAPSLNHVLLGLYHKDLRTHYPPSTLSEDIPSYLVDLMARTYTCELCAKVIHPDQDAWMEGDVERAWALQTGQLMRRTCGHGMTLEQLRARKPPPPEYITDQLVRIKGRACKACVETYLISSTSRILRRWDEGKWSY